ncbi:MAG: HAD family hydrolase [Candidatus Bathyarchaeota archaeon]|nr:HAD family hydrolase [Candidatus Bathyarchaeota archaeon]
MIVKAVIFDLDGTIASFNLDYKAVRAEARSLLIRAGLPISVLQADESIFEMLKKTEIFMKNSGKSNEAVGHLRDKVFSLAEKYELEAAKRTSLLPGASETLKTLRGMRLKIGLCTINSERSTSYILKRFRLAHLIDAVVTREKVRFVKPNVEHLEATLEKMEVAVDQAIVVGDSAVDMRCAKELKMVAVGLPTGIVNWKDLVDAGANYLITSLTDVPTLVKTLTQPERAKKTQV